MSELWILVAFIGGGISGCVITAMYYGDVVSGLQKHNIDLLKKYHAIENKPGRVQDAEYFRRGGLYALRVMCEFTKHRLEIDPSKLELFDDDPR